MSSVSVVYRVENKLEPLVYKDMCRMYRMYLV